MMPEPDDAVQRWSSPSSRVDRSRRRFLGGLGAAVVFGGLSGCSGNGDAGSLEPTATPTDTSPSTTTRSTVSATDTAWDTPAPVHTEEPAATQTGESTATPTSMSTDEPTPTSMPTDEPTPTSTPTDEPTPTSTPSIEEYLAGANGYDGTIADETGRDAVTIVVGAGDQGFRFAPPGVHVSPGTAVTWTWTSGARHNVVAADGAFDSGEPVVSDEKTFAHTFDDPGAWRYYCEPHRTVGMKGVVVVD